MVINLLSYLPAYADNDLYILVESLSIYDKILLITSIYSEVDLENQILCEPCDDNSTMSGGFDPDAKQVKLTFRQSVCSKLTLSLIGGFLLLSVCLIQRNLQTIVG